jgi:(E)-4-hydroxy-3-methylbut-2-enyl-diphosphate synthase
MGCVVNGPGEMSDADYGYVGSINNKINLYKAGSVIKRNIDQEDAIENLIELIKNNGDWQAT